MSPIIATRPATGIGFFPVLLTAYLLIGALVAAAHHYYGNIHSLHGIVTAVLGIVLWPLLLAGVNLHVH